VGSSEEESSNIPDFVPPQKFDPVEPMDSILSTDGLVEFGIGYHSWVIVMADEYIVISGDGPGGGNPMYMMSYRLELGGLCTVFADLGVLTRFGKINIRSIKMVCDNLAAVTRAKQRLTSSVYHNTECDWDLLKTFHELKDNWCKHIGVDVQWVKGHTDREGQSLIRHERLSMEANLLADSVRAEAA
jgi:hypothetical protein